MITAIEANKIYKEVNQKRVDALKLKAKEDLPKVIEFIDRLIIDKANAGESGLNLREAIFNKEGLEIFGFKEIVAHFKGLGFAVSEHYPSDPNDNSFSIYWYI